MPLANVAITLRRDERFGIAYRIPSPGSPFSDNDDDVKHMERGPLDDVALLKARLDGARRLRGGTKICHVARGRAFAVEMRVATINKDDLARRVAGAR